MFCSIKTLAPGETRIRIPSLPGRMPFAITPHRPMDQRERVENFACLALKGSPNLKSIRSGSRVFAFYGLFRLLKHEEMTEKY